LRAGKILGYVFARVYCSLFPMSETRQAGTGGCRLFQSGSTCQTAVWPAMSGSAVIKVAILLRTCSLTGAATCLALGPGNFGDGSPILSAVGKVIAYSPFSLIFEVNDYRLKVDSFEGRMKFD
jgi:hypothetical protein